MTKYWFQKAVYARPPYSSGWKKTQSAKTRIKNAIASRPKRWSHRKRVLSAGRSLIALANVTRDRETKVKARMDAKRLFARLK
jgi:hypothetical protein